MVTGFLGWQDYALSNGEGLQALPHQLRPAATAYLGLFGLVGITAYFGLLDIGEAPGRRDPCRDRCRGSGRLPRGTDREDQGLPRRGDCRKR